jgi:hypothetical protein
MRVQGWIDPVVAAVCAEAPVSAIVKGRAGSAALKNSSIAVERGRLELLASIRQRIRSGFYNSDSVIDDIGHGFAQALDPMV